MPVTAGLVAGGLQTVGGLAQSIFGGSAKKKALKAMEALQTPTYGGNASISDYYNKALDKYTKAYGVNPYESNQYKQAQQGIGQNMAAGIGALQDRRSAISGINKLVGISNRASNEAGIAAENVARAERNNAFGQLGSAVSAKSGDDRYKFQINQIMPYEKQLNILQQKAGGAAATQQAGLNNLFGGITGLASIGMPKIGSTQNYTTAIGGSSIPNSYLDYLRYTKAMGGI